MSLNALCAPVTAPGAPTSARAAEPAGDECACPVRFEPRSAAERTRLISRIISALPAIQGWCTERKAVWLADLIAENGCGRVLEIGIFGGRSLIPMAMAVKDRVPEGSVFGVEAWSNAVAVETATSAESDTWWREVDLKAIKAGFLRNLLENDLTGIVKVLEMSSDQAFKQLTATGIEHFDLIHVDGSHSQAQALQDVEMWAGLLQPGGILVLDDIGWPSVQGARDHLRRTMSVIEEVLEADGLAYGAYRHRA
jgi:predicted O-methyltransferase YrrM